MLKSSLGVIAALALSGCDVPTYPTGPGIASPPLSRYEEQVIRATISRSLNGSASDQFSDLPGEATESAGRVICSRRSSLGGPAGFDRDSFGHGTRFEPTYSWERADEDGGGTAQSDLGSVAPIASGRLIAGVGSRTRVMPPFGQGNCIVVPATG